MRVGVIGICAVLVVSGLMVTQTKNAAATEYGYFLSSAPSAVNSSYWTTYFDYTWPPGWETTTPVEAPEVEVARDSNTTDLYTLNSLTYRYVETNDFNGEYWVDPGESDYATPVSYLPPEDAYIVTVNVLVMFTANRPQMTLHLSTDDKDTWDSSTTIVESSNPYLAVVNWNVTSLRAWTPAMINTTDTWVKMAAIPTAGTHYYLDYLGFLILWYGEYEGGGSGSGDPPEGYEEDPESGSMGDYSGLFTGANIPGLLGAIGLIGLVALPAFVIWVGRNSEESKIGLFVKFLVVGMFLFTFVLLGMS